MTARITVRLRVRPLRFVWIMTLTILASYLAGLWGAVLVLLATVDITKKINDAS